MTRFAGKTALVTGGGRDIGRSVSIALAREGARVAINYCNGREAAKETLAMIEREGGDAILCQADVTQPHQVQAMMETVSGAFGGQLDVLVNLAGGMVARKSLAEMDEAFFDHVMTLNMKSAFLVLKAALTLLPSGASIINVASQAGRDGGGPGASIYATSKGAMMTWTRAMAKELGPQGIRVNAVCPGLIGTSFHDMFSKPEGRAATAGNTPLRREGHPDEVADVITFLASDEARFLAGVCLDVNGGLAFS